MTTFKRALAVLDKWIVEAEQRLPKDIDRERWRTWRTVGEEDAYLAGLRQARTLLGEVAEAEA